MNNLSTINWLKRFADTTKIQYLNNPVELKSHYAILDVFQKLDDDGSNSLDIGEVNKMFKDNNISITYDQLRILFSFACKPGSYELSFDEFKAFSLSETANKLFRKIVKEIRSKEKYKHPEKRADLLPYNFLTLLNFLSEKEKKKEIRNQIFDDKKKHSPEEAYEDIKRFMILFQMLSESTEGDQADVNIANQIKSNLETKKRIKELKTEAEKNNKSLTRLDTLK